MHASYWPHFLLLEIRVIETSSCLLKLMLPDNCQTLGLTRCIFLHGSEQLHRPWWALKRHAFCLYVCYVSHISWELSRNLPDWCKSNLKSYFFRLSLIGDDKNSLYTWTKMSKNKKKILKISHNVFHTSCQTGQMEVPRTDIVNDR